MRGKYSPTVTAAYMADQNWWKNYSYTPEHGWDPYDPEGFDSYGYNVDNVDRAGNDECEYMCNDADPEFTDEDFNWKYDSALNAWGFDGTKPVPRK